MKPVYIIVYLTFCLSVLLNSQTKPSITFTEEDGLAGNIVRDVVRDSNGILWIGTDFGLSKYDGNSFKNLYKKDGLPSNRVWALSVDEKNTVYAGCYKGGLVIFIDDSIEKVLYIKEKSPNSIRKLHYSNYYKKLLVGTDYGLYILQDTTLVKIYQPKDSLVKSSVLSISEYNSRIYFSVNQGLYELNIDTLNPNESTASYLSFTGRFSSLVMNDTLYCSDYNIIYKNPLNNIKQQYANSKVDSLFFIWTMIPFNDYELLVGGLDDGRFVGNFCVFNTKTNRLSHNPYDIKANTVLNIINDSISNTNWLCTDNGLTCLFNSPIEYNKFQSVGSIIDIGLAGDSLLVLTEDYVYYFNENKLVPIISSKRIHSRIVSDYNSWKEKFKSKFLKIFDTSRGCSFAGFTKDKDKLFINTAMGVISVPDLNTYYPFGVGTFKIFNNKSAYSNVMYTPLRYYPSIKDSIGYVPLTCSKGKVKDVFKILESKGSFYFASSYNGVYVIRDSNVYFLDSNNSVIDDFLTDIEKDDNGNVWCSSVSGNIFNVELSDSIRVKRMLNTSNSGLVGNTCKWLIFNKNYLYVGTNKGLNIISNKKLYSKNPRFEHFYNANNGFDFITAKSPIKNSNGDIYIHTLDKLIKIYSDFGLETNLNVGIRDVYIDDIKTDIEKLSGGYLSYSTKKISLNFFSAKYPTAKNIYYSYNVNRGKWINDDRIDLQSLRAGKYQILMDVFDKETNQHYSRTISFHVKNPFWVSWWFLSLSAILFGIAIYLLMRIRINRIKKIHEERTSLIIQNSELKLNSLQLQMNPHFIFNALNSIQSFIISNSIEDAMMYLGNLAGIIRTNLENASEEYVHLTNEITFLTRYIEIEKVRFKEKLTFKINNRIDDSNILVPPMLIQPIIENSIKHGILNRNGNGEISIDFYLDEDSLIVTIEDNGVGREFTKNMNGNNHNSIGLSIIKQRFDLLNKKTDTNIHKMSIVDLYNNESPIGTRVIIKLLIKRSK